MKVLSFATVRASSLILAVSMSFAGCGGGGGSGNALTATASTLATGEFQAALMGGEEVPPNASAASGTGSLNVDTSTHVISATVIAAGIAGTTASIREASLGAVGPVVVPLTQTAPGSNVWTAVAELTPDQFDALFDDNLYFEVQSSAFPNGEIRGQIILVAAPATTGGTNGISAPPAGGATTANAAGTAGGGTGTAGSGVPGGSNMGTVAASPGTVPATPGTTGSGLTASAGATTSGIPASTVDPVTGAVSIGSTAGTGPASSGIVMNP